MAEILDQPVDNVMGEVGALSIREAAARMGNRALVLGAVAIAGHYVKSFYHHARTNSWFPKEQVDEQQEANS